MTRGLQVLVLAAAAGLVLRLLVTGQYVYYVKPIMQVPLAVTALVLLGLAAYAFADAWRASDDDEGHDHEDDGHGHGHGPPRAAWLLFAPLLAILVIPPAPLGAFTAARSSEAPIAAPSPSGYEPLPPGDPVAVPLSEIWLRAKGGGEDTLAGRRFELTGFVTPNPEGSWWLTRISLSCCAADAFAVRVQVRDAPALPADTWVTVVGTYVPGSGTGGTGTFPEVAVEGLEEVPEPADPYEQ